MVDRSRIDSLIEYTLDNRLIEALNEFYHPDVVMQENCQPPRVGLAASLERQRAAQAMTAEIHEVKAAIVLHDGDNAAIEWHAEWTMVGGARFRIEEIALQRWRGNRIIHERFFYDPAGFGNPPFPSTPQLAAAK
ncbi:ester cyclase [Acidobacteria bacterium ACD]|jgi:ketosteroid isomerase-like protein|nr:ester cyclase [Acidobacteria bacterium ACD]